MCIVHFWNNLLLQIVEVSKHISYLYFKNYQKTYQLNILFNIF